MEFYEWILLNTLYLITPLILYLFFVAYNQNIEKKENHLFFQIALFSSFYLCIRFGEISSKSILILNIPLLIAYLKKENFSKGVVVNKTDKGLEVNVYIIVSFGVRISQVVLEAQKRVKYVLEKTLQQDINAVNVFVQGVAKKD